MDIIAATPIAPPNPATEAKPATNEAKDKDKQDEVKEGSGFDKALKKELGLLSPDADSAGKDAAEGEAALIDPAAAGVVPADAAQLALALPAHIQAQATGRPDGKPAGEIGDLLAKGHAAAAERATVERGAAEGSAAERGSVEQDAIHRAVHERIEQRLSREAEERVEGGKEKIEAPQASAESLAGGLAGSERGAAPAAPVHAQAHTGSGAAALEGLSSAAPVHKWSAGPTAANDASATPATARVDTPLGAPGWGEAFQQKIVWLVDRQQQSAELHVNPPHLGPVEVMLDVTSDGTRIAFCSPHAAVREAIEANLPDLQNALGDRGIQLGQTTVSADSSAARQQFSNEAQGGSARHGGGRSSPASSVGGVAGADAPRRQVVVSRGLVDTFA